MIGPAFEHLPEIALEIGSAPHLLLGLDFDGTLAPIVAHAKDAAVPESTAALLKCLSAGTHTTVAIVSGRPLAYLASHFGPDVILAGNHGLEISGRGLNFRQPDAERAEPLLHQISEQLSRRLLSTAGAWVEDKGLTASVHFRQADPSAKEDVAAIVWAVIEADNRDVVVRRGNQVLEIRPRTDWNKGSALRWILERLPATHAAVCYIGDDHTDEDVFTTVEGVTIRVGESESTAARFTVRDTEEAAEFLRWLLNARRSALPPPESEDSPPLSANR